MHLNYTADSVYPAQINTVLLTFLFIKESWKKLKARVMAAENSNILKY